MMNSIVKINTLIAVVASAVFLLGNAPAADAKFCTLAEMRAFQSQGHFTATAIPSQNGFHVGNDTDCEFQLSIGAFTMVGSQWNQIQNDMKHIVVPPRSNTTFLVQVPPNCGYQLDIWYGLFEPAAGNGATVDFAAWTPDWNNNGISGFQVGQPCVPTTPTPTPTPTVTPTPTATPTPTPTPNVHRDIDVEKTDHKDITRPGHTLTYVITVENTGNKDLDDVKLTDTVPGQLTVTSISDGGTRSGNTITWSNIHLDGGEKKEVTYKATVKTNTPNGHVLHNKVKARSNDNDVQDEDEDTTIVERLPEVLGVVATPAPVAVPVTARTGAEGILSALVSAVAGASGLVVTLRKHS